VKIDRVGEMEILQQSSIIETVHESKLKQIDLSKRLTLR